MVGVGVDVDVLLPNALSADADADAVGVWYDDDVVINGCATESHLKRRGRRVDKANNSNSVPSSFLDAEERADSISPKDSKSCSLIDAEGEGGVVMSEEDDVDVSPTATDADSGAPTVSSSSFGALIFSSSSLLAVPSETGASSLWPSVVGEMEEASISIDSSPRDDIYI